MRFMRVNIRAAIGIRNLCIVCIIIEKGACESFWCLVVHSSGIFLVRCMLGLNQLWFLSYYICTHLYLFVLFNNSGSRL